MSAPKQKPGRSKQDVQTPRDLLDAVERRFGRIVVDLAATRDNAVVENGCYYGKGSLFGGTEDSLQVPWARYAPGLPHELQWLNPPYANIWPWAAKCAEEGEMGARIAMLVPASIGSNWFAEHVHDKALVLAISPRVTFVGHTSPYPKDLILAVYGPWVAPGFDTWRWRP